MLWIVYEYLNYFIFILVILKIYNMIFGCDDSDVLFS